MIHRPQAEQTSKELLLKGDLLLPQMEALKEELLAKLQQFDQLRLNISQVSSFSLAFLQLLCAAHRSAVHRNKSLSLSGTAPEEFQRTLEEAGFIRHVGCRLDCQQSCIWMVRND